MTRATLSTWLSDATLFPVLQVVLVAIAIFAVGMELIASFRAGTGGIKLIVTRSSTSMAIYYGTYATISGVLIALCLQVEWAKEHRVAWVLLDTSITSYLCLFNPWFRLKLQALAAFLACAERR